MQDIEAAWHETMVWLVDYVGRHDEHLKFTFPFVETLFYQSHYRPSPSA